MHLYVIVEKNVIMNNIIQTFAPAILAFLGTFWIHPHILKIAIMKNLVDNPDARKLQRTPVPVIGGIAVFFGILLGLCCSQIMFNSPSVFMLIAAMMVMLYTGTIDDILNLSPRIRFIIEILVALWLIHINRSSIDSLWGLWGVAAIPNWISIPLTVFATVGIINAINLIDGVNGLSSGYCFMASVIFAIIFNMTGNTTMMILAVSAAGAIVPFFLHNVFGKSTKMFIGDGGTLVFGTMMSMFVINILNSNSECAQYVADGVGLVAFTLAVFAIPVFDTIRVMSTRILNGKSPFNPDKTHLHHMFIDLGFSHTGTTATILSLNALVILSWYIAYSLGASVDVQFYVVFAIALTVTFILYWFADRQIKKQGKYLVALHKIGKIMHFEKKGLWLKIQGLIDRF